MSGAHEFVARHGPPGEFPMSFELDWGGDRLADFFNPLRRERFFTAASAGVIRVGELVAEAPCRGSLELNYFSEAKIRYRLVFSAQGRRYEYIGEKVGIRPWNLHRTHTACYGVIYDLEDGKEISRSLTHFDPATLPAFLMSFHLTGV
jgi:hypothetical protein